MNIGKIMMLTFIFLSSCSIRVSSNEDSKVLGYGDSTIGIVDNDTIIFYYYDADKGWYERPNVTFNLPEGYKDVFGVDFFNFAVGIVIDNKIKIYDYFEDSWYEIISVNLPENYNQIVIIDFGNPVFGIVTDNMIKIIEPIDEGVWVENKEMEFVLPNDYHDVISGNNDYNRGGFGVVFDDRITFYIAHDSIPGWLEAKEIDFYLPPHTTGLKGVDGVSHCSEIESRLPSTEASRSRVPMEVL